MKKILLLFSLFLSTSIFAGYFQSGNLWYYYSYSSSTTVSVASDQNATKYAGLTRIEIPEEVTYDGKTYRVTGINSSAFNGCSALTSITIPNSVTSIGSYAFQNCSALTSITIPNSVTSIGSYAFQNCSALTSITIPNSVTSIEYNAFYGCSALTSITIPNSVTSIGSSAFSGCSALTSITIPNSVTSIGYDAFRNCSALTSITIPNSVTSIGSDAFYGCSALTSATLSNNLTAIAGRAFYNCKSLTSITIPNNVTTIGEDAFAYCSSLTSITLPNSLTTIAKRAFSGCSSLASITIPNSVATISDYAFSNTAYRKIYCESTTPPTIGEGVVDNAQLFVVPEVNTYKAAWPTYQAYIVSQKDCELKEVTVKALSDKSAIHQALGLDVLGTLVSLKVNGTINSYDIMMLRNQMPYLRDLDLSDASIVANAYEYTDGWCSKNDTLTPYAFTGTGTKIGKLILPKTLKLIQGSTINNSVRDLTILGGEIQASAFLERTGLANVVIDNAATVLHKSVFQSCTSLTNVSLPSTLRTIGIDAFKSCSSLQSIVLPEGLDTIGDYAFQGAGLTSVTIPANVSSLGVGAFAGGSSSSYSGYYSSETSTSTTSYYGFYNGSLREVTIPADSKLKTIPSYAFEGNGSLSKLSILGDSITTIANRAFCRCQLDTLILPPNLKSISTLSFGYCKGLKFVAMPKTLTEVPHNAFVGCTSLNDVQFSNKLTHIGHHAFADCTGLSNVDIPGLVASIGDFAFKDCNVNQVYSYLFDPFTIGQNTFSPYANANATLYIPNVEDTEMKYLYDTQWSQFLNRVRMDRDFTYDDFYANGDIVITPDDDPLNGDPNGELNPGSGLVVDGENNNQNMGNITLNGEVGDWASIIAGCNLNMDTLIINIKVEGKKWHFFGFPFELKVSDIITDGHFVVYEYDSQMRAERDTTGWKKITDKQAVLYPGKGYIFQFDFEYEGTFSFKVSSPVLCELLNKIILSIFPSEKPNNQNWNYVANPLLAYYDINDLGYDGPITFWDVLSNTYQSFRPGDDEYYLSPYEAFFLQNTGNNTGASLNFDPSKGLTKKQMEEKKDSKANKAPQRNHADQTRAIVNLAISNGIHTDATRVVINPEATLSYDLGYDAAKFLSTEQVPQLFSYDQSQAMCAINERPMGNGTVDLGIKIHQAGEYTIACTRMDTTFYLLDRLTNAIHDFQTAEAYSFTAEAGTYTSRFALVSRHNAATGLGNLTEQVSVQTTQDGIYVQGDALVQVYNAAGQMIFNQQTSGNIPLLPGVYMVVANGSTTKHVIQ